MCRIYQPIRASRCSPPAALLLGKGYIVHGMEEYLDTAPLLMAFSVFKSMC